MVGTWNVTLMIVMWYVGTHLLYRLYPFVCEGDSEECVSTGWCVVCASTYWLSGVHPSLVRPEGDITQGFVLRVTAPIKTTKVGTSVGKGQGKWGSLIVQLLELHSRSASADDTCGHWKWVFEGFVWSGFLDLCLLDIRGWEDRNGSIFRNVNKTYSLYSWH